MTINSCAKGKRGERMMAREWNGAFPSLAGGARRSKQYMGTNESPDVLMWDWAHNESKWVERLNFWKALKTLVEEAGEKVPFLSFKRNRTPVYVALPLSQLRRAAWKIGIEEGWIEGDPRSEPPALPECSSETSGESPSGPTGS